MESSADSLNKYIDELKNQFEINIDKNIFGKYYLNPVIVEFSKVFLGDTGAFMFFKTKSELVDLLNLLGYEQVGIDEEKNCSVFESSSHYLYISETIFDDEDNVKYMTIAQFARENIGKMFKLENKDNDFAELNLDDDGDLPF